MDTSYLTQQVTSIIGQLHNLFDEIGVPHHERDARESGLFASLSETLHSHLKQVNAEKSEILEECNRIMTTIKQMETSLDNAHTNPHYAPLNDELDITYPLLECIKGLKDKHKQISKLHRERFEQVKQLVQALESYSSHLEPSFISIKLPPVSTDSVCPPTFDLSPAYIESVDKEFTRVYEEYNRRLALVRQLGQETVNLWAELGIPQAQTDPTIVKFWRDSPEQLGLHQEDVDKLQSRRDKLFEEKRFREKKLKDLRSEVDGLWNRLNIDEQDRKAFLATNRGCGLRAINDLEDELGRLNELKRQNLHIFVEDAREKLQALWDELYFSEEEAVEFTPMFSDIYSDALLSAHENEIARLQALKEQRDPILSLIGKHKSIVQDRHDLATASQDASRLMAKGTKGEKRDPTRLLREEKMRKRIARELPKVEQELRRVLKAFENEYGRPFLVFGEPYLDEICEPAAKAAPPTRSKTPSGPAPTKREPASARSTGTVRGAPTPRSKTPAGGATLRGNPLSGAAKPTPSSASTNKSPSRIPARVPLGHRADQGNSPERQTARLNAAINGSGPANEHGQSTVRGKPGPLMAPPPKMRELQAPLAPPTPISDLGSVPSDVSRSGSVVRQVPPDDPYADPQGLHRSYQSRAPNGLSQSVSQHQMGRPGSRGEMPPPPRPAHGRQGGDYAYAHSTASSVTSSYQQTSGASSMRHASNDSTAPSSAMSGSENWETFGSDDDGEDASQNNQDAYYARLRAAHAKRAYGGETIGKGAGKKMKGLRGGAVETIGGSQDGWEDDETY